VEAKVMVTNCPKYNIKLDGETNFCPNCGKNLKDMQFKETSQNVEIAPILESNKKDIQLEETSQNVEKVTTPSLETEKKGTQFEETSQNVEMAPIYESKKKMGLKRPLFIVLILIAIFSISLVGADYMNFTSVGIFENKPPTLSLDTTISSEYQPAMMTFFINAKDSDGIIESYFIDFGDGTTSNQINPVHTFSAGTYKVNVTVTDNEGGKTSKTTTITVKNKSPTVSLSANRTSGKAPLSVSFTCSANDPDGTITKYFWSFNDGQTSSTQNPTHTFDTSGKTYAVSLTVTDNNGATSVETISITTSSNELPTITAGASPLTGYNTLKVYFTGLGSDSDGTITSYLWNFGDGSTSTEQNPSHTYTSVGTYSATFTVTDNNGGTASKTITITVSLKIYDDTEFTSWMSSDNYMFTYYTNQMTEELNKGIYSCNFYLVKLYAGYRQDWTEERQTEINDFDLSPKYDEIRDEYNEFLDDQWWTDDYTMDACDYANDYEYSLATEYFNLGSSYQQKATAHLNKCTDLINDLTD
jgi:PKD repeat protein